MDLHEENIQIPPAVFDSVITLPSVDFQKICRDMHNLADNIEIKSTANQLIFSCKGHFAIKKQVLVKQIVVYLLLKMKTQKKKKVYLL